MGLLNSKQDKIYREIWVMPYSKKLRFADVSKLLIALGCDRQSGRGANIVFEYGGKAWGMHPPHPQPYIKRPYLSRLRIFLAESGLKSKVENS